MVDQLVSMQLPKINYVMTDNGFKIANFDETLPIVLNEIIITSKSSGLAA